MPDTFRFGVFELDAAARELRREGRLVRLAPQAFRLLLALVSASGDIVSREQLQRTLWPDDVHVDFERSLNTAMRKLRVALQEDADRPRYIQTLPGHGYRFIAPVHHAAALTARCEPVAEANASSVPNAAAPASNATAAAAAAPVLPEAAAPAPALALRRRHVVVAALVSGTLAACLTIVALGVSQRLAPSRSTLTAANQQALDAYREGATLTGWRVSELSRAIESYERAVQLDPRFAPAWAALAHARASRAMVDGRDAPELRRARSEAQRALAIDGELPYAHLALGQVRFALDDDAAGAEIDLRRARALGATAGRDQLWLVWILHVEGRTSTALRVLDEALQREPANPQLHAWRGLLLHAALRYDEEIVELRRAADIDADSWEAALQLGLGYSRRRQYDLALPALRRAVALSDRAGMSLVWLGRVSADAGDIASAEHALQQLRELSPTRGLAPSLATSIEYHLAHARP